MLYRAYTITLNKVTSAEVWELLSARQIIYKKSQDIRTILPPSSVIKI